MTNLDLDTLNTPAFSLAVGPDGVLRYDGFNSVVERITGIDRATRLGLAPHECMPAAKADQLLANYRRCIEGGEMLEYEEELDQPAGRLWWRTTLIPRLGANGRVVGLFGFTVNITERKRAENELQAAVFVDPLTGICNRRRFERDLDNAVVRASDTGRPFSVVLADVDRFKQINDRHGHMTGDLVLKAVAARLSQGIRESDRLARIGGDEFAAIVSAGSEGAIAVALDRLGRKLAGPIREGPVELVVGVSLGAALWAPGMTAADMMATADAAMYREKFRRAA